MSEPSFDPFHSDPPPPELAAFFTPPPVQQPSLPSTREEDANRRADRLASLYTPATRRAEVERRARLRAVFTTGPLKNVPPLGEAGPTEHAVRYDLWPPRPDRPVGPPSRHGDTWTQSQFVRLVKRFAKARGTDFGVLEFCRWAGVASSTLYRHADSWPALRAAAGLPPAMARPDRRASTLAALLRSLHLNRNRTRPLTGAQLARAAGVSRSVVGAYGGVRHLRDLYRQWVRASEARGE
ncbi:hypothetical protein [Alienimonas chondri]|uniref:Helix-turn-helix domain-containing protein n=1 Tax=Alienimonas chondri TaxID=2681879 RepID=A0ABX1VAX9_9PLAN|nr:hypothetical protein [Alienimonas chondri]NNJ25257.1 hypothetical protein [Alienimonas chondri]